MRILRILPLLAITFCAVTAFPAQTSAQADFTSQISKIEILMTEIEALGLHHGTANSLMMKLQGAKKSYEQGNEHAALNKLAAFINQVKAQSGKKISEAYATMLLDSIDAIINPFDPAEDPLTIAFRDGLYSVSNPRALVAYLAGFIADCLEHPYGFEIMTYVQEMSLTSWYQILPEYFQHNFIAMVVRDLDPSLYW
jgi:hypothetical protein